ncbi:MAG: AbrB/MazE/SpoVT family DNA-binding domain-containing protein [Candidatus Tectomicrobia bacterium]|nr:AbrB/MazE/SpoVT family DNA-binding domain-containing protein [Candidatus Tectomicrobia bacterium]
MEIRVEAWGNGAALRIPDDLAAKIGLRLGLTVDVISRGEELVESVPNRSRSRLETVVEGITEGNLHREVDFGPPIGRESR